MNYSLLIPVKHIVSDHLDMTFNNSRQYLYFMDNLSVSLRDIFTVMIFAKQQLKILILA